PTWSVSVRRCSTPPASSPGRSRSATRVEPRTSRGSPRSFATTPPASRAASPGRAQHPAGPGRRRPSRPPARPAARYRLADRIPCREDHDVVASPRAGRGYIEAVRLDSDGGRKAAESLAFRMAHDIVDGALDEGVLLGSEAELLTRYGVSRAIFREALRL